MKDKPVVPSNLVLRVAVSDAKQDICCALEQRYQKTRFTVLYPYGGFALLEPEESWGVSWCQDDLLVR
jgi:hypothetical protein